MSQYDFGNLESPTSGTLLINTHLEPWRNALHSSHIGPSRPSYATAGILWISNATNPWVINVFDGSDDIPVGTINTTTNLFTLTGDVKAPSSSGLAIRNYVGTVIATLGASTSTTVTMAGQLDVEGLLRAKAKVSFPLTSTLTIASGLITAIGVQHLVDGEGAASDDLDTILGGSDGQILIIRCVNAARVITIKHNTGNIKTPGGSDVSLDDTAKEIILKYDGTLNEWHIVSSVASGIFESAAIATTSGTTVDVTGLPSGVKRISINFVGVSTNGSSNMALTIGDSGGLETSGYLGTVERQTSNANLSAAFTLTNGGLTSPSLLHGQIVLTRAQASSNTWVATSIISHSNTGSMSVMSGSKALSATLDRFQINAAGDTFDAGFISYRLEF